jgi:hypothetical protein
MRSRSIPVPAPFAAAASLAAAAPLAAALALSACFLDGTDPGPTLRGRFGNRLEGLPPRARLDSSLLALGLMRELSGGSYTYRMGYHSMLGGGSASWEVTYRAGGPVREEYASVAADGTEFRKTETAADWAVPRDARQQALPAPVPLDSLYAECRKYLEDCRRPDRAGFGPPEPFFSYDGNYILSSCGCSDPAIQDGPVAVYLGQVRWARE